MGMRLRSDPRGATGGCPPDNVCGGRLRSDPRGGMDVLPAGNAPPLAGPPIAPSVRPTGGPAPGFRRPAAGRRAYGIKRVQHRARYPCADAPGDPLSSPTAFPFPMRRCMIRHRPEAPKTPVMREEPDGGRKNK